MSAVFEMRGGEITGNTAVNGKGNDVYVGAFATIKLSGSAKIGDLMLSGDGTANNAKLIVDGTFTGSVAKLDLTSNSNNTVNTLASSWAKLNSPFLAVVTRGDGCSDEAFRAVLAKFPLGDFTNADCTVRHGMIDGGISLVTVGDCYASSFYLGGTEITGPANYGTLMARWACWDIPGH